MSDLRNLPNYKGAGLDAGSALERGDYLLSPNGRYQLILQVSDGNLVLYRIGSHAPLWATMKMDERHTFSKDVRIQDARMQEDGNFTVNADVGCIWDTLHAERTPLQAGAYLRLHDNAAVALHAPDGRLLWQTQTHLNEDWLSSLPDHRRLTALSVPGTHDSGAYLLSGRWTQCQRLSIQEQLWAGIRSLDIRCRYMPDEQALTIHHGDYYCGINFADVLRDVSRFLTDNPREMVFMMVKQEKSTGRDREFAALVEDYFNSHAPGQVYTQQTDSNNPLALSLADVRGKIVLLKRYTEGAYGFDVKMSGGSDSNIQSSTVRYQDVYGATSFESEKKRPMRELFEMARNNPQDGILYINYVSMSGVVDGPEELASDLNDFAWDCIGNKPDQRLGIVPMDFPSRALIYRIINTNS